MNAHNNMKLDGQYIVSGDSVGLESIIPEPFVESIVPEVIFLQSRF